MTRPYSSDLRGRVVASLASGSTCREAAKLFGVSVASVVRWSQLFRATGNVAPKRMGGRRRMLLLPERDWLLARIAVAPDLTLRAVRAELAERGVKVGHATVWAFLASEGLTFKKTLHAAGQERPDVARKRERWERYQGRIDPARLVFVDG
jgi:transposase